MSELSFSEVAKEVRSQIETKYRLDNDNEELPYFSLSSDRFDSLQELVYSLHNDELPNDWVYATIVELLDYIIDYDVDDLSELEDSFFEIVDNFVQLSNYELLSYYSDYPSRLYDIDEAISEYGAQKDTIESLRIGIYSRVLSMLADIGSYIEEIYQDQF